MEKGMLGYLGLNSRKNEYLKTSQSAMLYSTRRSHTNSFLKKKSRSIKKRNGRILYNEIVMVLGHDLELGLKLLLRPN